MCKSIGHRPLWGRCPVPSLNLYHNLLEQGKGTADNLTLLRLFDGVIAMCICVTSENSLNVTEILHSTVQRILE